MLGRFLASPRARRVAFLSGYPDSTHAVARFVARHASVKSRYLPYTIGSLHPQIYLIIEEFVRYNTFVSQSIYLEFFRHNFRTDSTYVSHLFLNLYILTHLFLNLYILNFSAIISEQTVHMYLLFIRGLN